MIRKEYLTYKEVRTLGDYVVNSISNDLSEKEAFNIVRIVAFINASAFKGYERLDDDEKQFNNFVYDLKEKALSKLINIYISNQWDVSKSKDYDVIYFSFEGVQISFHVGNISVGFLRELQIKQWDMVMRAYRYEREEYNEKKRIVKEGFKKFRNKVNEDISLLRGCSVSYLRNANRRKRMGIFLPYKEVKQKINDFVYDWESEMPFMEISSKAILQKFLAKLTFELSGRISHTVAEALFENFCYECEADVSYFFVSFYDKYDDYYDYPYDRPAFISCLLG